MSARYRIVHFVPDAVVESRIPIAALVDCDGRVSLVKIPHIPGPDCLGGREKSAVIQMILEDLTEAVCFQKLPPSVGPHAFLGGERSVPNEVGDPVKWVERLVANTWRRI